MAKLDDLIEELSEQGRDEDVAELEKLRGSSLRKQAGRAQELESRVKELEDELSETKAAPARAAALKEYGVDVDSLSKAEKAVIAGLKGELTREAIAELVEEYDLPVAQGSGETTDTPPAAQRRRGAGGHLVRRAVPWPPARGFSPFPTRLRCQGCIRRSARNR